MVTNQRLLYLPKKKPETSFTGKALVRTKHELFFFCLTISSIGFDNKYTIQWKNEIENRTNRASSTWREFHYFEPFTNALVTSCTVRCGLLWTKASNLGEDTICSMFLTTKFKVVSFKFWLEQVSAISSVSNALEVLSELSRYLSQCFNKCGITYLSAACDKAYTCFSNFSEAKVPP